MSSWLGRVEFVADFAEGVDEGWVVRVGFFVSDLVSIEPRANLSWVDVEDGGSTSRVMVGVGVPVHFSTNPEKPQGFVRPLFSLYTGSAEGEDGYTQMSTGLGVGFKLPVASQLAVRLEGVIMHTFETDDAFGDNALSVRFGLSFLTR